MRTALTERFDLTVPVVGAPMAGAAGGELAAAISAAGGLGMIGAAGSAVATQVGTVVEARDAELAGDDRAHADLLAAVQRHDFDTAFIYAGQSVGLVRQPRPAAEVVAELATADDLLRRASSPA